ncbi:MAG: extracellular solute-binding protein [Anaerolineaceae bacterium]|nr:extracellular solute-binding protein [Anaerolineaceae bacterium]
MPRRILDIIQQPEVIAAFSQSFPGIDVDWVAIDPAVQDSRMAQGIDDSPDLIYLEGSRVGELATKGYLSDITSFAAPAILDFPNVLLSNASYDGKTYAVPLNTNPVVMYYRKDVFAKAGLPTDPERVEMLLSTWDTLLSACQTIKAKENLPCFDLSRTTNNGLLYETMLGTAGLGYYRPDGGLGIGDPQQVTVLEEMSRFWKAGVTGNEPEWSPAWLSHLSSVDNPVALVFGPPSLGEDLSTWIAPERTGEWGVCLTPAFDSQHRLAGAQAGGFLAIPAKSKHIRGAWVLANYLSSGTIESHIRLWTENQLFPALPTAYADPVFHSTAPYFSSQVVGEIYAKAAGSVPDALVYSPAYGLIHAAVVKAIRRTALGVSSPGEALRQASEDVQQILNQP